MKRWGTIFLLVGIGIFLLFGGAAAIAFLISPEVPLIVKVAVFSVSVGILLLTLDAARETWGKKDKYERIER